MRYAALLLALLGCASESGSGTTMHALARLPGADDYLIGFAADGAALFGTTMSTGPILRLDGDSWVPATTDGFMVAAFATEPDGTPLVAYRVANDFFIGHLVDGAIAPIHDGALGDPPVAMFVDPDGTHLYVGFNALLHVLPPGTRTWLERNNPRVRHAVQDADGRLFGVTDTRGLTRIQADGTQTQVVSCALLGDACAAEQMGGFDGAGRLHLAQGRGVFLLDPAEPLAAARVSFDADLGSIGALRATPEGSFVAGSVSTADDVGTALVFAIRGTSKSRVPTDDGATLHPPSQLVVDRRGAVYLASGDWLGVAVATPGDQAARLMP